LRYTPVIPAFRRQRQEDQEFKASLSYIVRSCLKNKRACQVPVAHACNPSYSGGRHQEAHGSKPARQIVHKTLSQKKKKKKNLHRKGLMEWLKMQALNSNFQLYDCSRETSSLAGETICAGGCQPGLNSGGALNSVYLPPIGLSGKSQFWTRRPDRALLKR
jgi:hypothetical protein